MKIKKGKVRNQQLVITLTVDDEEIEEKVGDQIPKDLGL